MSRIDFSKAVSLELEAAQIRREQAIACLNATDWVLIRHIETGTAIPAGIAAQRAAARDVLADQPFVF